MTTASDRQSMTSYWRPVVTTPLSRMVVDKLTTYFSASGTFWPLLMAIRTRFDFEFDLQHGAAY